MTQRIGCYEVLEVIGEGAMATVYRGRDPRLDRSVAIKVLDARLSRDAELVGRFKLEAIHVATLTHPHLVAVLDFIAEGSVLALIMEHADGKSLAQIIREERGQIQLARAVHLMGQALSAIEYAHQQGLVHNDIRPSNILVQKQGPGELAKVTDTGVATILGPGAAGRALGSALRILPYRSPERLRNPRHEDARSDIYALGATFFEMLTGRVPFASDSQYGLMQKIDTEPAPDLLSLRPALPGGLSAVVGRALAKHPEERFQTCREFGDALSRALTDPAPQARVEHQQPPIPTVQSRPQSPPQPRVAPAAGTGPAGGIAPGRGHSGATGKPAAVFRASPRSKGPSGFTVLVTLLSSVAILLMVGQRLSKSAEERARIERAVARERARADEEAQRRKAADEKAKAVAAAREREPTVAWVDPSTGLMWEKEDNGRDLDWPFADYSCSFMILAGYSDWRLPEISELEGLHDASRTGEYKIKPPFQLTGCCLWSATPERVVSAGPYGRGSMTAQAWVFDFNEGKRHSRVVKNSPNGTRALCVRGKGI